MMRFQLGSRPLSALSRWLLRVSRRIRYSLRQQIAVDVGNASVVFEVDSAIEEYRATSLLEKEPGTITWLDNHVQAGDCFLDVGANIGVYTLLAARRVGDDGVVYAVEPHAQNFQRLLNNIELNHMQNTCTALSIALSDSDDILPFNYYSATAGSSMSQLDRTRDADGNEFSSSVSELKAAFRLDRLVEQQILKQPDHIKVDVDGLELQILEGARNCLAEVKTIQVEVQQETREPVQQLMLNIGFSVIEEHYTHNVLKMIENGHDVAEVSSNLIFVRSDSC